MTLRPQSVHPHQLVDAEFEAIFGAEKPIIFAYNRYPSHGLAYKRTNHMNMHVRGYQEERTITTPFDMVVTNEMGRFRVPTQHGATANAQQPICNKLAEQIQHVPEYRQDLPEVGTGIVRTNNRNGHSWNECSGSLAGSAKYSG